MKKLIAVLLIMIMIPVCSCAATISDFNVNALICGESSLDESTAKPFSDMTMYTAGGCSISFKMDGDNIEKIYVQGDGISFLAYSMAAVRCFDDSLDDLIENSGRLFSVYLLARQGEDQFGKILTGEMFAVSPYKNEYIFMITK